MHSPKTVIHVQLCQLALLALLAACSERPTAPLRPASAVSADNQEGEHERGHLGRVRCDADNAGITLPPGFCALVVADLAENGQPAPARHMAVMPNGDVFVAINAPN